MQVLMIALFQKNLKGDPTAALRKQLEDKDTALKDGNCFEVLLVCIS